MTHVLLNSLLIFALRVTDVTLGTIRTVVVIRGSRYWAALIGFIELMIWVVALGRVFSDLSHPFFIVAYSGGFATGTLCGMLAVEKMPWGVVSIHIVSGVHGDEITREIRNAGFGATMIRAEGKEGAVSLIEVVASKKNLPQILKIVRGKNDKAFITVEEVPKVFGGYMGFMKKMPLVTRKGI